MELDKIQLKTTWNDAAGSINQNFAKIKMAVDEMLAPKVERYVHVQNEASSIWIVDHQMGRYPSVTVVDSAGTMVFGEVVYDNENQVTITFTAAFSGKAYLN